MLNVELKRKPMHNTKTMLLTSSSFTTDKHEKGETFKMIPTNADCPFNECIFNNEGNVLAIIGKDKKNSFMMVPKLNDAGHPELIKSGQGFKQTRTTIEKYYEYYLEDENEIREFVKMFAINADSFDFNKYFSIKEEEKELAEEAVL
jgi:hypothetical protein